jgi:hypothetical protein
MKSAQLPIVRRTCWFRLTLALIATMQVARAARPADEAQTISTRIQTASGPTWERHTIDRSSQGADGVKLGDLNGDGRPDIVTGWEEGGEVRVYLNPGTAKARETWPRVTVGSAKDVEEAIFVDLDGDGRLDVVSATEGKTRTVYGHRFTGSPDQLLDASAWSTRAFPATASLQMWMQAAALDLDGQHGPDLLLGAKGNNATIGWLQAPAEAGNLAAWPYHKVRDAGWIMSLVPQDMDGDGDQDIVFSDRRGPRTGVFWLENPGAVANRAHTAWREHAIGAAGREVMFADVGDIDGDGLIDVAVAVKPADIFLCLRQPDGTWQERVLSLDRENLGDAKAVKITDVNGDGRADLLFTCENATGERTGVVWLEQQRAGPWLQRPLGGPAGVKFDLMQVIDLDGDGDLDVITCEERDQLGVVWYENPTRRQP